MCRRQVGATVDAASVVVLILEVEWKTSTPIMSDRKVVGYS